MSRLTDQVASPSPFRCSSHSCVPKHLLCWTVLEQDTATWCQAEPERRPSLCGDQRSLILLLLRRAHECVRCSVCLPNPVMCTTLLLVVDQVRLLVMLCYLSLALALSLSLTPAPPASLPFLLFKGRRTTNRPTQGNNWRLLLNLHNFAFHKIHSSSTFHTQYFFFIIYTCLIQLFATVMRKSGGETTDGQWKKLACIQI